MSVEHPTCPHCGHPLDRMVDNGVGFAELRPCTNPKCPGKLPGAEDPELEQPAMGSDDSVEEKTVPREGHSFYRSSNS